MLTYKEYLERSCCPVCESDNINGTGDHDAYGYCHTEGIRCADCGAQWRDVYVLSAFADVVLPETEVTTDDHDALVMIAEILNGRVWDADTVTDIADIVRDTGRTVLDMEV